VDSLRTLQQFWLESMANLKWQAGEPGDAYEDRVNHIYDELGYKIEAVRVSFSTPPDAAAAVKVAAPKAKPKAAEAAKAK